MSVRPHLWNVMDMVKGDAAALRKLVQQATREQLILLNRRFGIAAGELRTDPRFAAHAEPGSEGKLSRWVVTQGRKAWQEAKQDPSRLPREPPSEAPDFPRVMEGVYQERFGAAIPEQEPDPADDPKLSYDRAWEAELWKLIDVVNAGVPLTEAVSGYTRSELAQLDAAIGAVLDRLQPQFEEALGDDPSGLAGGSEWTTWVIGQGKEKVDRYLAHPDEAPRSVPEGAPLFAGQLDEVYEDRYGAHIPSIPAKD